MREALDRLVCARWPELLRQREAVESCMQYGFTHGDGWFALVDAVCATITAHASVVGTKIPEARQIKEKLGGIRIYLSKPDEYVRGAVSFVGIMSYRLCELSGAPGALHCTAGHLQTLSPGKAAPDARRLPDAPSLLCGSAGDGILSEAVTAARSEVLLVDNLDVPRGWIDIADALLVCLDGNMRTNEARDLPYCMIASLREADGKLVVLSENANAQELGAIACAVALAERTNRITGASGPTDDDGTRSDTLY